ncbi:MAG: Hsp70 family protein [Fibrobacterota bacterium]|nr:Hsp70 family protein [Fibrobacterota bacterium]
MAKTQSLGIDLGTSNCALALSADGAQGGAETLDITQVLGPNRIGEQSTFASALYFPAPGQFPSASLTLPWTGQEPPYIAGDFAREFGALVPDRLVTSAKSWLSYRSIDPTQAILPWGSANGDRKISPLEASRLYLEHLRFAYAEAFTRQGAKADWETIQAVVTVPASFDEVARKLTAQAAKEAGLGSDVILLEEPQAAFYAWLDGVGTAWRNQVQPGDTVLVCDVGGGTTDFSLIAVSEQDGNLDLERVSVGRHILLGGDNMDLALAYVLRGRLEEDGKSIDDWQFLALTHAARRAKEALFESPDLKEVPISIPSRGSSLFAGTVATSLPRELLQSVVVDGFFALTKASEMPAERPSAGLRELGLPYEADAVISKHLAAFLAKAFPDKTLSGETLPGITKSTPDAVLFNGGVFRSKTLRDRVLQMLRAWNPEVEVRELAGAHPDLAVARGAALYGKVKQTGKGHRIRAGASRGYYIGLDATQPAITGYKPTVKALCVVPQGMEEGTDHVLPGREFGLMTGSTATFRFFSSPNRADVLGAVVANAEKELEETAKLEMELPHIEGMGESSLVPVKLHARLTELGTLELWMQRVESDQRWELNFNVRTE